MARIDLAWFNQKGTWGSVQALLWIKLKLKASFVMMQVIAFLMLKHNIAINSNETFNNETFSALEFSTGDYLPGAQLLFRKLIKHLDGKTYKQHTLCVYIILCVQAWTWKAAILDLDISLVHEMSPHAAWCERVGSGKIYSVPYLTSCGFKKKQQLLIFCQKMLAASIKMSCKVQAVLTAR